MQKTYNRINWENYPSDRTPLNETNLNKLDVGVNELDNRIITLDNTKFDKTEASQLIKNFELDKATGIITVTYLSGATATIDTMLEKLAINFDFDKTSQKLVIVLDDGTVKEIDLTALITEYEFKSTDTVAFSVDADGNVSAIVKDGSIQERHLRPNYLSDIMMESAKAEASAVASDASAIASESSAVRAESWTVGGTNTRTDEDTDNAKFYYEASKQIFNDFENVGAVVGVKGDAETDYRAGLVNITAENVGALPSKVVISQVNFDDLKTTGIYHIKSAVATNRPTDSQGTLIVEFDVGTPFQLWMPDNQYVIYKRIYTNNTWSDWGKLEAGNADTAKNVTAEAGSKDANRHVWFSDGTTESKRNFDDEFMYNPATNTLNVANVNGTANKATNVLAQEANADANRHVWFSDSSTETKRAYDNDFNYNPNTNTLKVVNIDGTASKAVNDADGNNIVDTYATKEFALNNFNRLGLNEADINTKRGNWSVGISNGTTPDSGWGNVVQFDCGHFVTQIDIGCNSNGNVAGLYYRNKYTSGSWSNWSKISKTSDILNTATAIEASTSDDNIVGAKGLKEYVERNSHKLSAKNATAGHIKIPTLDYIVYFSVLVFIPSTGELARIKCYGGDGNTWIGEKEAILKTSGGTNIYMPTLPFSTEVEISITADAIYAIECAF